jgi:hypothetical protein
VSATAGCLPFRIMRFFGSEAGPRALTGSERMCVGDAVVLISRLPRAQKDALDAPFIADMVRQFKSVREGEKYERRVEREEWKVDGAELWKCRLTTMG